jgi:predicted transcriptional regulator
MTPTQKNLLELLNIYMTKTSSMYYDNLKALTDFKTFESTFNALLNKGYIKRFNEGNGQNTYILTDKI